MKLLHDSSCSLAGREVDLDVDEDHDAARDVERPEGGVHDVADILAQLKELRQE